MPKNVFAGVGISKNDDPFEAGKEATEIALAKMKKEGGKKPAFGLIFCSGLKYGNNDRRIQKFLNGVGSVLSKYSNCKWFGCTTAGEISNFGASEGSVVALLVDSKYIHIGVGVGGKTEKMPRKSGRDAVERALKDIKIDKYIDPYIRYLAEKKLPPVKLIKSKLYSILVLTNGFSYKRRAYEDDIIEGIQEVVGSKVTIFGGSAADDFTLKGGYIFCNGKFYKDNVICVIINTNLNVGFGVSHGYEPQKGKTAFVTKSEGYIVKQLDQKPAFERYSELINKPKNEIWPKKTKLQLGPISEAFLLFAKKLGVDIMKMSPLIEINCNTPLAVADLKGRFWIKILRFMFMSLILMLNF